MGEMKQDNDILEIEQTWNKVKTVSKQTGLRDGISDGKESIFQKSFDSGYEEGFKNGFLLGKHKGCLMASKKLQNDVLMPDLPKFLQKTSRGDCLICEDEKLLEKEEQQLTRLQNERYNSNAEKLSNL